MNGKVIVNFLAKHICNKNIIFREEITWYHDVDYIIVGDHWRCALHEIAHWMASDPSCRHLPNLGLPEVGKDVSDIDLYNRLFEEETIAIILNKWLYFKYFLNCEDSHLFKEDYNTYHKIAKECSDTINANFSLLKIRALELMSKYTSNIKIDNNIIFKLNEN